MKPKTCELPSCSRFGIEMIKNPEGITKHYSGVTEYYCGGQTLSGNSYAVLDDLMKAIAATNSIKAYFNLSDLLHRAAAQVDLIIQDQANEG